MRVVTVRRTLGHARATTTLEHLQPSVAERGGPTTRGGCQSHVWSGGPIRATPGTSSLLPAESRSITRWSGICPAWSRIVGC